MGGATPARRFHSRTTVTRNLSRSQEAPSTELLGNSMYLTRFIRSMTNTLNEQESKIEASIATIEENIGQERPELRFILPEMKRGMEELLEEHRSNIRYMGIILETDKIRSYYPSSTNGWTQRFEKLADKANKTMCKMCKIIATPRRCARLSSTPGDSIVQNRCDTVSEPYPPNGREELGTVANETMDVSRQKRTQPDAKKDGPVQKGNQLTADSDPNPCPRSEKRKSSGYNNPDHTKNCREGNESHVENDIESLKQTEKH